MKKTCILYSPIESYSGYGSYGRTIAKSLIELYKNEWDIKIISCNWGMTSKNFIKNNKEWEFLMEYIIKDNQLSFQPDIMIWHTIPNEVQKVGKYNINITAGIETDIASGEFIEGCNRADLIIVSSEHSRNALLNSKFKKINNQTQQEEGITELKTKVEVLFEGFDLDVFKPITSSFNLNIKEDFAFLFTGTWLQGDLGHDRKNIGSLIKIFSETFKNKTKKPSLILKTTTGVNSYLDKDEIIKRIKKIQKSIDTKNIPNIYLIHGDLSDEEMNELYNHSKIKAMISLSRGEGFGRPLLEFGLTQKPIITTNFSGPLDFLKPEFTCLINGKLEPVHPSAQNQWIINGSNWFNPDLRQASNIMIDMFENYKKYKENGRRQAYHLKNNFNLDKYKDKMREIFDNNIPKFPTKIPLNLPKLNVTNLPKLKKYENK
jgi:glycosyltransferase involved in cell wall biosynthesis